MFNLCENENSHSSLLLLCTGISRDRPEQGWRNKMHAYLCITSKHWHMM